MSNEIILSVHKREKVNKGERRRLRKKGQIPGIYYSHDSKESVSFYMENQELNKAKKADTRIFTINVGNKKRNVLFKSVQYHPVSDEVLHIDLYGIRMDQVVTVSVKIELTGTAKGVVEGGIVVQNLNELDVECLPGDIPSVIHLDVSELEIGQNLKVEDIILDEKVIAKSDMAQIVVSVTQAMKEEELIPQTEEELLDGEESEDTTEEGAETTEDQKKEESASDDNKGSDEG